MLHDSFATKFFSPSEPTKEGEARNTKHIFETKLHNFSPSEDEVDDIIERMRNLDVFDVDKVCWKMLSGKRVTMQEKRQLTTLHKNIKTDTGMKIISGTALASYKDGTGSPLSGTYIFRYTMELIKNIYDSDHGDSGNDILSSLLKQPKMKPVLHTILNVVNEHYKPDEKLTSFEQFECWKQVVSLNAETIQSLSKPDNRILTLEECQHISVTVPNGLNNKRNVVRAVNAFSVRVLNTPYKKELDAYNDSSLASVSFIHVAGSSERSQKTFSNKSVAMSLTDEMERAVRYAVYYAQVIPIMVFIQINKDDAIPTTSVLEYGEEQSDKKYASGQAYNIAEKHHEYIPKTVSYIDPAIIEDMRPLLMTSGPIFEVGDDMGPKYPREHWLQHTPIYVNENHQNDSEVLCGEQKSSDSGQQSSVIRYPFDDCIEGHVYRDQDGDYIYYLEDGYVDVYGPDNLPKDNTIFETLSEFAEWNKYAVLRDVGEYAEQDVYHAPRKQDRVSILWNDKKWYNGTITKITKSHYTVTYDNKQIVGYMKNALSKMEFKRTWKWII